MAEIRFQNVSKVYNPGLFKKKITAVRGLSFAIERGEVFGLIGPNGAGKSSTIRLLLGLSRPSEGKIFFRDAQIDVATIQRSIGYLPENPYLYDHLTLLELLVFAGRTSGLELLETRRRSQALMEKLALAEARKRPLRTFSKGMLQRAGICFALLHDPDVVILDEPMSGLDPIGRRMVFELIRDLKERGKTVFFCSHILTDVERISDRIGVMARGRLCTVLDREQFSAATEPRVRLLVRSLSANLHQSILEQGGSVTAEGEHQGLSLPPTALPDVLAGLQEEGGEVLASLGGGFSLEEQFMKIVEECA